MKKKLLLIIGIIAFFLMLGGAGLLYSRLSKEAAPNTLVTGTANSDAVSKETEEIVTEREKATEQRDDTEPTTAASQEDNITESENASEEDRVSESETDSSASKENSPSESETDNTVSKENSPSEKESETEKATVAAPDFTVVDEKEVEVHLSDFKGTPVIVNFWASWCPPCKSEMPDFQEAYEKYGEQIQFMMLNVTDGERETMDSAKSHVEEQEYTFPVFFDTQGSASIAYGASSIPATYFVDAEGNVAAYAIGAISLDTLEKGIGMILP